MGGIVSAPMTHTVRAKTKLLNRVRRIRGQVEAVERALEQEFGGADVLQLVAAGRGAINGLMAAGMGDPIRLHVVDPARGRNAQRTDPGQEPLEAGQPYPK